MSGFTRRRGLEWDDNLYYSLLNYLLQNKIDTEEMLSNISNEDIKAMTLFINPKYGGRKKYYEGVKYFIYENKETIVEDLSMMQTNNTDIHAPKLKDWLLYKSHLVDAMINNMDIKDHIKVWLNNPHNELPLEAKKSILNKIYNLSNNYESWMLERLNNKLRYNINEILDEIKKQSSQNLNQIDDQGNSHEDTAQSNDLKCLTMCLHDMPNNTNMDIPIDESNTRYSKYFTNDKLLARLIEFYTSDSIIFHENKNIDSDVLLKNTDAIDKFKIDSYFQYRNLLYAIIKKGYFKKIGFIDSNTPSYAICNTNFRQAMKQFQWNSLTGVQSNHQAKTTVKNLSQKGHVYNYYFSKDLHQLIGLTPFTKEFETKLGEIWPIGFAIAFRTGLLTIKSLCNYLERDQPDPSLVQAIENFINDILDLKVDLVPKLSAIINLELSKRNYVLPLETVGPYRRSYFCLAIVNYLLCNKDIKLPTFYDTLENEKRSKYDIHAGMTDEQINEAKIRFLQQSYIRTTKKLAHKFTNSDNRISKHEKSIIRNKFRFNSTNSTLSNKMPAKPAAEDTPDPKLQEKMINNNSQESTINKLTPQIPENIVSSRSLVEARESNEITSSQNIDSATENFGDQRFKIITIDDSDDELPKQNNKSDAITNEIFHTLMNNETLLRWDETKDKYLIKFILNNLDDLKKDCTYKKLLVLEPQIFKGFKPENLRKRKEHLAKSYEYLMKLCGSEKIQTKEDKVVFEERIDSLRKLMNISVKMEVD